MLNSANKDLKAPWAMTRDLAAPTVDNNSKPRAMAVLSQRWARLKLVQPAATLREATKVADVPMMS